MHAQCLLCSIGRSGWFDGLLLPVCVCRLELRGLVPENDLPATVAALSRLRPSVQLSLGLCTSRDGSLSSEDAFNDEVVNTPPLGCIAALTELRLEGKALPLPDWGQLSGLCALRLNPPLGDGVENIAFKVMLPNVTRLECTVEPDTGAWAWHD